MSSSRKSPNRGRVAVWVAGAYFVAMAVGVTYPGLVPFNRVRPFVLGVPFVFAWYLVWIVGALIVFLFLYWSAER